MKRRIDARVSCVSRKTNAGTASAFVVHWQGFHLVRSAGTPISAVLGSLRAATMPNINFAESKGCM